jgi:hypothetical protein
VDNGIIGTKGHVSSYVPGDLRLDRAGDLRVSAGDRPTLRDHLGRMERPTPMDRSLRRANRSDPGRASGLYQPLCGGARCGPEEHESRPRPGRGSPPDRDGGTSGWRSSPMAAGCSTMTCIRERPHHARGRVEILDANNRELDSHESPTFTRWRRCPRRRAQRPGLMTPRSGQEIRQRHPHRPDGGDHHGTHATWEEEIKVRYKDGRQKWIPASSIDEFKGLPKGATVIDRAPAGRVRGEKVGSGEGNAAFGWGSTTPRRLTSWPRTTATS